MKTTVGRHICVAASWAAEIDSNQHLYVITNNEHIYISDIFLGGRLGSNLHCKSKNIQSTRYSRRSNLIQ